MANSSLKVGLIGCGNICKQYLTNAKNYPVLDMVGCADLDSQRAKDAAEAFDVPRAYESPEELLEDPGIDLVINLTIPAAHAEVSLAAIENGKHVWTEKPLAAWREEGVKILEAAKANGVRVGGAPDTFFGAAQQTARRVIDEGQIGRPLAAMCFMLCPGREQWHPNPGFFFEPGGGPMHDMGPYYLTALVNLFGAIKRINSVSSILKPERVIESEPLKGQTIDVTTPDHVAGNIEFESGVVATIVMSFATYFPVYDTTRPITVYGTEGTLQVPDPNNFDSDVLMRKLGQDDWQPVPCRHTTGYGRSVGTADMAAGILNGRPHRGSAELVFHVLDAMQGFLEASEQDKSYYPAMSAERPAALPEGLPLGDMD